MPTFCSNCGSLLAADVKFCPSCGAPTSYPSNSNLSPSAPSSGADALQQKGSTDYGSPSYGLPDQSLYAQFNPYEPPPPPPSPRRPWSNIVIGVISGIVVSILILGSVGIFAFLTLKRGSTSTSTVSLSPVPSSQVPPQSCRSAFSDEFNGKLDARWNWINPNGSATYNMATNGFLSISASPNSDINPDINFNAPRLLQPINGNFTVETLVEFSPNIFFQSAGILIWQNQTKFFRFERGYSGGGKIISQKDDDGLFTGPFEPPSTTASLVALRVQKQGDHFTFSWHEPNQVWQINGETDMHFDSPMVGLDLLATYYAPQTTAYYDYFRVSCT